MADSSGKLYHGLGLGHSILGCNKLWSWDREYINS